LNATTSPLYARRCTRGKKPALPVRPVTNRDRANACAPKLPSGQETAEDLMDPEKKTPFVKKVAEILRDNVFSLVKVRKEA
jgi:hypothetical protein